MSSSLPASQGSFGAVETEEPLPPAENADNLDMAVDTLGAVLRVYGQNAFDLNDIPANTIKALCEQWALHALYAAAPPNCGETAPGIPTGGKRDWSGLRAFFAQHRRKEQEYVARSFSGMQQIVRTFIHELNRSLIGEQHTDSRMQAQLERLETAAQTHSIDALKLEVFSTITTLTRLMEERKQAQQRQIESLYAQIQELGCQLEEARQVSNLDPLTQLYNRKSLDSQLALALDIRSVFGEPACLFLIDADHFKSINDNYGHAAGDMVLKKLADCLAYTFPRKGDFIARYGGEEFAILFRDASLKEGRQIGERLLRAVRALRIEHDGKVIPITVSVGVSEALPNDTPVTWLERADRALYSAKQRGRNRMEER
ncbi:MAG TPA: GGDEF domain-containing protein [Chthonomonadaceae bacterium]|nr:GGDEF domain-containing protein [Chthonomonadaceae bacterium]